MSHPGSTRGTSARPFAAFSVERINRRFGSRVVLRDVTFEVSWGEAVALVGSNGAGKSTLLRIGAGVLSPSSGTLTVGGSCVGDRSSAMRGSTGLLAGDAFLYDDLTAFENVRFAVRMSAGNASAERLHEFLGRVGLGHVAHVRIRHFSSGMRKRLALARVMAIAPPVLLLDEPYASLDEEAWGLVDELVEGWKRQGRAVIMATHRRDKADCVCDRVLCLTQGVLGDVSGDPDILPLRVLEVIP